MSAAVRPRGAARRELMLEAVLRIVAEIGPEAVTHRRVAAEAGLPLASTTYWFASKEELLTAALALAATRDVEQLRSRAAELVQNPNSLDAAVELLCDPGASRGSLIAAYALWLEAARRPALREIAQRWTDAYHETVATLLAAAGSSNPRDDAHLLVAAADGLVMEELGEGGARPRAELLKRLAVALTERS